ncbi:unnamed protein product [Rhizoctonia solani]|uniref:DUF6593 domain-containing protein n=1 Tax=Rhizoctonia solani TaxID=456999 RepID=A0A8H3DXQ8_9AGAM|nr:unnamed protein product [Rhizoctonia solani]
MTTYTLVKNNPRNTVLTDPEGSILYKISTQVKYPNEVTTVTRANELDIIAVIHWNSIGMNTVTMDGKIRDLNDVFPRSGKSSISRLVTIGDRDEDKFKWHFTTKLYCTSVATGLNVATYHHALFADLRGKKSTIDIVPGAVQHSDILVVSWMVMEKESQDGYLLTMK